MPHGKLHSEADGAKRPRVRITYDVRVGDATEKKELPFVVGVLGDFSGDPGQGLKSLGERDFVQVDRRNFSQVMTSMTPGLILHHVENTLDQDVIAGIHSALSRAQDMPWDDMRVADNEETVTLRFTSEEDFWPAAIAGQIPALAQLLEIRRKLVELQTKVDVAPDFEMVHILQSRGDS